MKTQMLIGTAILVAGSVLGADPKAEVKAAATKLTAAGNYSWRMTSEAADGGGFRPGPSEGKVAKDGTIYLSMQRGDNTMEAVLKGDKGALKMGDDWMSLTEASEAEGESGTRSRFIARMLRNFRAPGAEAADLADKVKELKQEGEAFSGEITAAGATAMLTRWRRAGGPTPEVTGPKGSARFWIKDGMLSKFQYHLQGTINFNGNDIEVDRTTTIELKDIGTTKFEVPEGARKKLS